MAVYDAVLKAWNDQVPSPSYLRANAYVPRASARLLVRPVSLWPYSLTSTIAARCARGPSTVLPNSVEDAGTGFIMNLGYTVVSNGWDFGASGFNSNEDFCSGSHQRRRGKVYWGTSLHGLGKGNVTYQANVRSTDIRGSRGFYLGSRLQLQLLDSHISHDEFLNFAGYGHGEFRYKFDDTRDSGQENYLWINHQVFENLIAQLDKKDEQIERKDSQLDGPRIYSVGFLFGKGPTRSGKVVITASERLA